jgi:hypothetical protein
LASSRFRGKVIAEARAARKSSAKEASQLKREKEGPSSGFGHDPANAIPSPFVSWDLTHFCCFPGKTAFKKTPISQQPYNLDLNESFSDITEWIEKRLEESDIWADMMSTQGLVLDKSQPLMVGYVPNGRVASRVPNFPIPHGQTRTFKEYLDHVCSTCEDVKKEKPRLALMWYAKYPSESDVEEESLPPASPESPQKPGPIDLTNLPDTDDLSSELDDPFAQFYDQENDSGQELRERQVQSNHLGFTHLPSRKRSKSPAPIHGESSLAVVDDDDDDDELNPINAVKQLRQERKNLLEMRDNFLNEFSEINSRENRVIENEQRLNDNLVKYQKDVAELRKFEEDCVRERQEHMEAKERAEAKAVEADLQRNVELKSLRDVIETKDAEIADLQGKLEKANIDLRALTQELNMSLVKHQQRDVAEQTRGESSTVVSQSIQETQGKSHTSFEDATVQEPQGESSGSANVATVQESRGESSRSANVPPNITKSSLRSAKRGRRGGRS